VRPDWEPYLGLRYPASDIPVQARQLFLKNDIRLIREVASVPVEILAVGDAGEAPLDLSLSRFRQPSPIHIEYLKNMGVDSSFVSAIVVDGALWGLISCHHGQPLNLPAKRQVQLAALTNHLASDLAGMAREVRLRNELACARVTSKLIQCITVTDDWTSVLLLMAGELCEILGADGMALQFDGNTFSYGVSAPSELIPRLINESIEQGSGLVHPFIRNPKAPEFQWLPEKIGGFLTLPLSHFRADALVFFRKETTRKVNWAGQPEKVVDRSDGVARLRPRQSFAIWQETVRGTCESWSVEDIAVAGSIKNTLSDIVITAHYFRQSYETPATARHRLAHEANPNPVVLADEIGIVVFQNQAAVSDPLLASLQSLDQLAARMPDLSEAFTSALYSLVHDEQEIRMQIAPDAAAPRWLEASLLTDDGRFVGYSIRLV
jgi:light-regulated signal transduction histidine kinase (bacteriophytochrome)